MTPRAMTAKEEQAPQPLGKAWGRRVLKPQDFLLLVTQSATRRLLPEEEVPDGCQVSHGAPPGSLKPPGESGVSETTYMPNSRGLGK